MADERDPKLSQRYRELEPLEPPPALDQAIVAAARAAADSAHAPLVAPAGRHRWYYSLAAAAVLVFAVALTLHLERERADPEAGPPLRLDRELRGQIKQAPKADSAPAAQAERAPAFTPDPQASAPREPAAAPAVPSQRADEARLAADRAREERAAAMAAAAEANAAAETGARRDVLAKQKGPSPARSRASSVTAPLDAGPAARQNVDPRATPAPVAAAPENPDRWLERIAELRSRGRHPEADRELAAFRKAYPDYALSEVMRERVEGTVAPR